MLEKRKEYVEALLKEIKAPIPPVGHPLPLKGQGKIETIYFGGGTPSLLEVEDLLKILEILESLEHLDSLEGLEITLEANPGDLSLEKLRALRAIGINRLSIGIQSLEDRLLTLIGRRHTAAQAEEVVRWAQDAGFDNISVDLMYGLPTQTMADWQHSIAQVLKMGVQHISCYCLSYEEGTALTKMLEAGQIDEIDEDTENAMYDYLCEQLQANGFIHYEVSNFALIGRESKHNSSYWNDTPYVGIGAGAHSYDGAIRSWNPNDLEAYIQGIQQGTLVREQEVLTDEQKHEEAIMLGLRTAHGIKASLVDGRKAQRWLEQGLLRADNGQLIATQKGIHILNRIITDLL